MSHTLEVVSVKKENVQADNTDQLVVTLDIKDGEKTVETRKLGFPYDISKEDLNKELTKFLENYDNEISQAEASKDH